MNTTSRQTLALLVALLAGCATLGGPAAPTSNDEAASSSESAPAADAAGASKETLILEGTPEVPASLDASLRPYLSSRSATVGDITADGRSLLISTRFGETSQVHEVARPLGARRQRTFLEETVFETSYVPGGDGALVYGADQGGNEQLQLFRLEGAETTLLTDPKSRNGGHVWSPDGDALAYYSNARNGRDFDIWIGDGRDPASARIALEVEGWWGPHAFSPDGRRMLVWEYRSISDQRLHLLDLADGKVRPLLPRTDAPNEGGASPAAIRAAVFATDGRSAYVTSDHAGDFVAIYRVDLESGRFEPLASGLEWNVESIDLSPDGRTLAFLVNREGLSELNLLDLRTGKTRRVEGLPTGVASSGLGFAKEAPVVAFSLYEATRPGDAFTYDLRTGELTRWTESEQGGLDPERAVEPELVRFESFDGLSVPAFVFRPEGAGPFPVVVHIHGGPEAQYRPSYTPTFQYLAQELGIAIVAPNVRGSDGYGKRYLSLDNGMKREDSVRDIGALLDWIDTRPDLDAGRVAVSGGSYGGYMVLASLTHYPARIRAGIDVVGISSFTTFLENTADYRRDLRRAEYGDERDPEMYAFLERISPLNRVEQIRSALFVAQGANDPRVPASEAEQIVEAVRKTGKDVWYMLALDEGHGFRKKRNSDMYRLLWVMFLERHLTGGERESARSAP